MQVVQLPVRQVVFYADLRPCYNAFIESHMPGSKTKDNFTIIGPGVSKNPAARRLIDIGHTKHLFTWRGTAFNALPEMILRLRMPAASPV